jgi:hypothetical protein
MAAPWVAVLAANSVAQRADDLVGKMVVEKVDWSDAMMAVLRVGQ